MRKKEEKMEMKKRKEIFLMRFSVSRGAKVRQSCRSRKMLTRIDYLLAKIGADTAENEPSKILFCLAEKSE